MTNLEIYGPTITAYGFDPALICAAAEDLFGGLVIQGDILALITVATETGCSDAGALADAYIAACAPWAA